ncbi:MerR family transcriptional regulator [Salibacterium halotolerans]|uniref:MerR family transcriptional regulator, glutamine synthetase repressor n=1 Tax=Salibacterium halotolerans TaxID=1884432 RepID=A0A1I5U327_9BACI|nr:MerR family transcriptional regulator [Salibacterium halotolerans]SFP89267.1 MerR family transcriptional regulator, glutamine synthetase repressor [Salibacterium halotolerans]
MTEQIPPRTACFPISVVQELTSLSARQIRYYEDQGLIAPKRNHGNQRIFSLEDIDRCARIKELIDQGLNTAGVKTVLDVKKQHEEETSSLRNRDLKKLHRYYLESDD